MDGRHFLTRKCTLFPFWHIVVSFSSVPLFSGREIGPFFAKMRVFHGFPVGLQVDIFLLGSVLVDSRFHFLDDLGPGFW